MALGDFGVVLSVEKEIHRGFAVWVAERDDVRWRVGYSRDLYEALIAMKAEVQAASMGLLKGDDERRIIFGSLREIAVEGIECCDVAEPKPPLALNVGYRD